jgi:TRAP-type C4-dicarboxylate transport system permease small subunit
LAALLALAFAIVLDVLLRWLFNSPITGVRDAASLFVAVVIASSLPICIAERRHITIRFLGKLLKSRWDAAFETFGNLATLVIFALMAWQLWLYADYLAAEKETTMVLGWPVSPWWRGVSIIVAFCVPVQVIVFLQSIKLALFGGSVPVIEDYNKPEGVKR